MAVPPPTSRRPHRRAGALTVLSAALLILAACGGAAGEPSGDGGAGTDRDTPIGYREVEPATLAPGDPVPVPTGEVVLTVGGRIANPNVDGTLRFDLATLERLGLVEYRIDDTQAEGREATFRGVLLSSVLEVAGVEAGATTLETVALNDYRIDIPLSDVERYPVLVATSVDGERMPVDRFGPLRVIYPYGAFGLEPPEVDDKLIWQLTTIEVV